MKNLLATSWLLAFLCTSPISFGAEVSVPAGDDSTAQPATEPATPPPPPRARPSSDLSWLRVGLAPFTFNYTQKSITQSRTLNSDGSGFGAYLGYERLFTKAKFIAGVNLGFIHIGKPDVEGSGFEAGVYLKRSFYQPSRQVAIMGTIEIRRDNLLLNRPVGSTINVGVYEFHPHFNVPLGLEATFPVWQMRGTVGVNYHFKLNSPADFSLDAFKRFGIYGRLGINLTQRSSLRLNLNYESAHYDFTSPAAGSFVAEAGSSKQNKLHGTAEYLWRF